ncbi:unnamed protein product [Nippostrongylus brasiliensis]|uniref:BZIP domain-containing protein n=1 Tax=Nippostrongylus brasiliensis TaxID=27835 RepID=A0A158QZ47_NIPBR|nr:unnamed protein product [Nippostrongylus brasiliensis]
MKSDDLATLPFLPTTTFSTNSSMATAYLPAPSLLQSNPFFNPFLTIFQHYPDPSLASITIPKSSSSFGINPSFQRVSSPDNLSTTSRIRRGRPQQDINDDDDPSSQKRRHRRLYARQYRAQMRHKVDEVKVLRAKLDEMRRTVERLESALDCERREHQQKAALLSSMIRAKVLS